jgi:uncharacterized protein YodC (DUF2158 family)
MTMTLTLKLGDIVQLKSGGPKMTVTRVLDNHIHTAWFAGSKGENGVFPFQAVILYQEENKNGYDTQA